MSYDKETPWLRDGKPTGLLVPISQIGTVIGILENKWERPHSGFENAVIRQLQEAQEAVRQVHVAPQESFKTWLRTLPMEQRQLILDELVATTLRTLKD